MKKISLLFIVLLLLFFSNTAFGAGAFESIDFDVDKSVGDALRIPNYKVPQTPGDKPLFRPAITTAKGDRIDIDFDDTGFDEETTDKGQQPGTESYKLLVPIPGQGETVDISDAGLARYLRTIFRYLVGFAGIITVLSMIYAGIEYIGSGANLTSQSDAKNRMKAAFIGLTLALTSYLILNTINPELVNFRLKLPEIVLVGNKNSTPEKIAKKTAEIGSSISDMFFDSMIPFAEQARPGYKLNRIGTEGCPGCVELTSEFNIKTPVVRGTAVGVDPKLLEKLKAFNADLKKVDGIGLPWVITEAYPPTYVKNGTTESAHADTCHKKGTCIDANLTEQSGTGILNSKGILAFIKTGEANDLYPEFEVGSESDKNLILASSDLSDADKKYLLTGRRLRVLPPKDGKPRITAPHFSVYYEKR